MCHEQLLESDLPDEREGSSLKQACHTLFNISQHNNEVVKGDFADAV